MSFKSFTFGGLPVLGLPFHCTLWVCSLKPCWSVHVLWISRLVAVGNPITGGRIYGETRCEAGQPGLVGTPCTVSVSRGNINKTDRGPIWLLCAHLKSGHPPYPIEAHNCLLWHSLRTYVNQCVRFTLMSTWLPPIFGCKVTLLRNLNLFVKQYIYVDHVCEFLHRFETLMKQRAN